MEERVVLTGARRRDEILSRREQQTLGPAQGAERLASEMGCARECLLEHGVGLAPIAPSL